MSIGQRKNCVNDICDKSPPENVQKLSGFILIHFFIFLLIFFIAAAFGENFFTSKLFFIFSHASKFD